MMSSMPSLLISPARLSASPKRFPDTSDEITIPLLPSKSDSSYKAENPELDPKTTITLPIPEEKGLPIMISSMPSPLISPAPSTDFPN